MFPVVVIVRFYLSFFLGELIIMESVTASLLRCISYVCCVIVICELCFSYVHYLVYVSLYFISLWCCGFGVIYRRGISIGVPYKNIYFFFNPLLTRNYYDNFHTVFYS